MAALVEGAFSPIAEGHWPKSTVASRIRVELGALHGVRFETRKSYLRPIKQGCVHRFVVGTHRAYVHQVDGGGRPWQDGTKVKVQELLQCGKSGRGGLCSFRCGTAKGIRRMRERALPSSGLSASPAGTVGGIRTSVGPRPAQDDGSRRTLRPCSFATIETRSGSWPDQIFLREITKPCVNCYSWARHLCSARVSASHRYRRLT